MSKSNDSGFLSLEFGEEEAFFPSMNSFFCQVSIDSGLDGQKGLEDSLTTTTTTSGQVISMFSEMLVGWNFDGTFHRDKCWILTILWQIYLINLGTKLRTDYLVFGLLSKTESVSKCIKSLKLKLYHCLLINLCVLTNNYIFFSKVLPKWEETFPFFLTGKDHQPNTRLGVGGRKVSISKHNLIWTVWKLM